MRTRIDKDKDGFVTEAELKDWIKYAQSKYIYDDANKQLEINDVNKDGYVTWSEYSNQTYGFLKGKVSFSSVLNFGSLLIL